MQTITEIVYKSIRTLAKDIMNKYVLHYVPQSYLKIYFKQMEMVIQFGCPLPLSFSSSMINIPEECKHRIYMNAFTEKERRYFYTLRSNPRYQTHFMFLRTPTTLESQHVTSSPPPPSMKKEKPDFNTIRQVIRYFESRSKERTSISPGKEPFHSDVLHSHPPPPSSLLEEVWIKQRIRCLVHVEQEKILHIYLDIRNHSKDRQYYHRLRMNPSYSSNCIFYLYNHIDYDLRTRKPIESYFLVK